MYVFRLAGFPPFWHRKQLIMLRAIMEGRYEFVSPEWDDISEEAKDMVSGCSYSIWSLAQLMSTVEWHHW